MNNILLIRHQQACEKTANHLRQHSLASVALPFSEILSIDTAIPDGQFQAILFTSPIGPSIVGQLPQTTRFKALPVFCVGDMTAESARRTGFDNIAHISPDANLLAHAIRDKNNATEILYPCAKDRAFDFVAVFSQAKINYLQWLVYENNLITPSASQIADVIGQTNVLFLYSKRTAQHFFKQLSQHRDGKLLEGYKFITISQNVADAIPRKYQNSIYVAQEKNENSMIECLRNSSK